MAEACVRDKASELSMFEDVIMTSLAKMMARRTKGDFIFVDDEGVKWYNANQCAYVIERTASTSDQSHSRTRAKKGLDNMCNVVVWHRKVDRSAQGDAHSHNYVSN